MGQDAVSGEDKDSTYQPQQRIQVTSPCSCGRKPLQYRAWMTDRMLKRTLTDKTLHEMATDMKPNLWDVHTWECQILI